MSATGFRCTTDSTSSLARSTARRPSSSVRRFMIVYMGGRGYELHRRGVRCFGFGTYLDNLRIRI